MQNSSFLVLLRPIFGPKMKTIQRDWGAEVVKDLLLFGPESGVCFFFLERTQSWSEEVTKFW